MSLRTEYEFTLPRGYVDSGGSVHRHGTMRLATARDELEPLRNPTISGPDDPRLTILILARVVTALGDLQMITANEIEGLFAVDLAFLQDFYGVINFGTQEEYEALLAAQASVGPVGVDGSGAAAASSAPSGSAAGTDAAAADSVAETAGDAANSSGDDRIVVGRTRIEEIPRSQN